MKTKIVIAGAALLFAIGILGISVYRLSVQVLAEGLGDKIEITVTDESTPEIGIATDTSATVDYALTWPGILPDHFLYPVKMLRDKIWLFLTTDPLKKAELLLKLADKRIWSVELLAEKGKVDLAAATAVKAEGYLEKAVEQVRTAEEKGKNTEPLWEKLSLAVAKHEQLMIRTRAANTDSESAGNTFGEAIKTSQTVREEVKNRAGAGWQK